MAETHSTSIELLTKLLEVDSELQKTRTDKHEIEKRIASLEQSKAEMINQLRNALDNLDETENKGMRYETEQADYRNSRG